MLTETQTASAPVRPDAIDLPKTVSVDVTVLLDGGVSQPTG